MNDARFPRVASLKTAQAVPHVISTAGIALDFDDRLQPRTSSPLAQPLTRWRRPRSAIASACCRWKAGTARRRRRRAISRPAAGANFGQSGAKLIWGGEAVAVRHDGRANPHQLMLNDARRSALARAARARSSRRIASGFGAARRRRSLRRPAADALGPLRPAERARDARAARRLRASRARPALSRRRARAVATTSSIGWSTTSSRAATLAPTCGFQFVDVKHCHGYLGTSCSARATRPGRTAAASRTARASCATSSTASAPTVPGLAIGVRLSAFDAVPYRKSARRRGRARASIRRSTATPSACCDDDDLDAALARSRGGAAMLEARDVRWICVTAGSPYYCPHVQRPALVSAERRLRAA